MRRILPLVLLIFLACSPKKQPPALDLTRGEITLCGSGADKFGTVDFSLACSGDVRPDFNLATALLHSFEYTEAEKVFAKVIDKDPSCTMAYWGAAMCNFHALWAPPTPAELEKGAKIIAAGRSMIDDKSSRESDYLEAIATIYDDWDKQDHATRTLEYEQATAKVFEKYPDDKEAAIFYALALRASAEPTDKTFRNQKKAGQILDKLFAAEPNHPGIAHYLIHNYDYPELAELGLVAARKYAAIAAASAHAQHMPSHIFTRLGLWDESITSNINSVSAAQCYAQSIGAKGHWDEEVHGLDYLIYAYLQKADDKQALEQMEYLLKMDEVFPVNLKEAYAFAAAPMRYALERKDWESATKVSLQPANFPWEKFGWERANFHFGRMLGSFHTNNTKAALEDLAQLNTIYDQLTAANEKYKASLVLIQTRTGESWAKLKEGKKAEAIKLMNEAADMEDATEKHPVTPGAILPAREILADMYFETGDYTNALKTYEANIERNPNRFNALFGAAQAAEKLGDRTKADVFYKKLSELAGGSSSDRPQMTVVRLKGGITRS